MTSGAGRVVDRSAGAALALLSASAATLLATHHPVAPAGACIAALAWFAVAWRMPQAWLVVVPAALPIADFSPWTGWIAFDEFDLLLLVTLAARHARRAWRGDTASPRAWVAMLAGFALFCAPGLWRGLHDAGSMRMGWFDGYADPVNSLRVVKSMVFALALLPMIEGAMQVDARRAARRLARGILIGLAMVTAVVVWERVAYPGLVDTSEPYRTTAMFWEMHVGGAAIDGYLALATPFVAWALWSARGKRQWAVAAVLALLVGYACLTTFSRGVYAAVLLPLLMLAGWLWARRWLSRLRWRTLATVVLIALIGGETLVVLAPDSFMLQRMGRSQLDYQSRVVHWQNGLALLKTPIDRWLGIGLGRLPSRYAAAGPDGEFPGMARWVSAEGRGAVRIDGPRTRRNIGGLYGLTQQVPFSTRHRLQFDVRTPTGIDLYARVCQSHLLYDGDCQEAFFRWPADIEPGRWRRLEVDLAGPAFRQGRLWPRRGSVFTIAVVNPGGHAEFDDIALLDTQKRNLLVHGSFDSPKNHDRHVDEGKPVEPGDLARWWPAAQFYFLPWHIDNLYLELLIERGIPGLALGVAMLAATLRRLSTLPPDRAPLAPFIAAALLGATIVGSISSLLDAPRTAFLLCLLIACAWHLDPPSKHPPMP